MSAPASQLAFQPIGDAAKTGGYFLLAAGRGRDLAQFSGRWDAGLERFVFSCGSPIEAEIDRFVPREALV